MLTLQRLKIHKCRVVAPGTELEFNDGLNLLLGKNGAGKTTMLRLIAAAIGSSFQDEFHPDDLDVEYEYKLETLRVRCRFQQGTDNSAERGPQMRSQTFRVELDHPSTAQIVAQMHGNRLRVTWDKQSWEREFNPIVGVAPSLDLVVFLRSLLATYEIPAAVLTALGDEPRLTHRLDEGLDWLRVTLAQFAVLFAATTDERLWCNPNMPYPGAAVDFRGALASHRGKFATLPEVLTLHSDQLPFLRRICEQLDLQDATWTLSFLEHDQRRHEIKRYGRNQVYVTTRGGTRFPLDKLSYGQQRLFAFHLHAAMHPHAVVADELTNGMHHAMVDGCLSTIGERQAFLATQNPLLLDHIGFDSEDEVRRTFVLCDLQNNADGEKTMLWRNMSPEEAHEFFADYQVGIQHVNAILRTRGLW